VPKNPNKRPCQTPGCRAWAMRGLNHCRSHSDHLLGRRAAGPPIGNRNAVKSGRNAHPVAPDKLKPLAFRITRHPDRLPQIIAETARSLHRRSHDPVTTLLLLERTLQELIPFVSDNLFASQLDAYLRRCPLAERAGTRALIWKHALPMDPVARLRLIKAIDDNISSKTITGKTIDGTALDET